LNLRARSRSRRPSSCRQCRIPDFGISNPEIRRNRIVSCCFAAAAVQPPKGIFGKMLHIIYLMLLLSIYQDETISCYFAAAFQRARLSVGKGRPWLFFLCFIRQVFPLPRECSGRATPIPRRRRCTLIVADDVERAPLIAPSGRSTVLAPAEAVSPAPGDRVLHVAAGSVWGFL
jgi:hypothetical protein